MEATERESGGLTYKSVSPVAAKSRFRVLGRASSFFCILFSAVVVVAFLSPFAGERNRGAQGGFNLEARQAAIISLLSTKHDAQTLPVLLEIPGSDNSSVLPQHDPRNYCTIKGKVWDVQPPQWFCAEPAHRVDSCRTCKAGCLSPAAALQNLAEANASTNFRGWNPQGGGVDSVSQSVTVKLPGSGAILRAILWANAGDVKHDPQWIKIWSAYEGEDWKLIDVLDVRHLQGSSQLTVLPLRGGEITYTDNTTSQLPGNLDATTETRAKYWRINPGGIYWQSIPRSVGLCTTPDCTNCGTPAQFFNWAAEEGDSAYSVWLRAQHRDVSELERAALEDGLTLAPLLPQHAALATPVGQGGERQGGEGQGGEESWERSHRIMMSDLHRQAGRQAGRQMERSGLRAVSREEVRARASGGEREREESAGALVKGMLDVSEASASAKLKREERASDDWERRHHMIPFTTHHEERRGGGS